MTIWAAEATGEEPGLVRIVWSKRERRGWPELVENELGVAAGAWLGARAVLQGTVGAAGGGLAFWEAAERGNMCRRELQWPWLRRRHEWR